MYITLAYGTVRCSYSNSFGNSESNTYRNCNCNNNNDIVITFTLPTISQETDILEVLLNKENNTDADLVFFDNFRFLESITINEEKYIINNITTHELYELYLLFDINNIQKISDHINKQLGDLTSIRSQEADFSFFIDFHIRSNTNMDAIFPFCHFPSGCK